MSRRPPSKRHWPQRRKPDPTSERPLARSDHAGVRATATLASLRISVTNVQRTPDPKGAREFASGFVAERQRLCCWVAPSSGWDLHAVREVRHDRFVPRISEFYGIVIYMYRPDHPPPHFHAQYGEQIALGSFEVLNGSLPPRALRLVREWAALHTVELAENWEFAQALEELVKIDPLP